MEKKRVLKLFLIFLLSLPGIFPFLIFGLPNTHDGQTHVVRLASFHQALTDGQFPPRWAGNLTSGFGSPVFLFGFSLPSWFGEFFHLIGFSFEDSVKAVFILSYIVSGIFMYLFLAEFFLFLPAFVGAVFYQFAPYRFLDLYVRGDVGEALLFAIVPLVFWQVAKSKGKFSWWRFVLGSVLVMMMILSHQSLAGVFLVVIFLYSLVTSFSQKKSTLFYTASIILTGLFLTAWTNLPLVFEKYYTNLNLLIETNYHNQFPKLSSLLYSGWHWGPADVDNPDISMSFQLGIAQWLGLGILAIILFFNLIRTNLKKLIFDYKRELLFLSLFFLFLFLITGFSKSLWDNLFFLPPLLYPWRLLGIEIFMTAVIVGMAISLIKSKSLKVFLSVVLIAISLYGNRNHLQVAGRTHHPDDFYLNFSGTSDMWGEFLPKGVNLPKSIPEKKVEVLSGEAEIKNLKVLSNKVSFQVMAKEKSQLLVNTFYFPGWRAFVDGKERALEKQELVTLSVLDGQHDVEIKLGKTLVRAIGDFISLIMFAFLLIISVSKLFKIKNEKT